MTNTLKKILDKSKDERTALESVIVRVWTLEEFYPMSDLIEHAIAELNAKDEAIKQLQDTVHVQAMLFAKQKEKNENSSHDA